VSLKSVKNAIQELEASEELHAVTQLVHSRELTKNAEPPLVNATNSQDAEEPQLHDSVDQLLSRDQMPDALSQEPPRVNVTELEFANKQRSFVKFVHMRENLTHYSMIPSLFSCISFFLTAFI